MAAAVAEPIVVRRIPLDFPDDLDVMLVEGSPEESYAIVGLSLLLPHLEPYLIRSMRAAADHLADPKLLADIDAFNAQEGQHYRQHVRFNDAMKLRDVAGLEQFEAEVAADYRRFTASKSLRFNLAYAEGFEAFTTALARFSFESNLADRLHPAARDLLLWHLVEELEHRTVAFDVYEHVCGGYLYRLFVGLYAHWHLDRFVRRASSVLRDGDREALRSEHRRIDSWTRRGQALWRAITGLYPKVLATYLPWYTPHAIEMPAAAKALADRYSARSRTS